MNRKIVITGVSSEIGEAIFKRVYCEGDNVILHYHTRKPEEKISHTDITYVESDFSKPESLNSFCKHIKEADIVINVAAANYSELLVNLNDREILTIFYVNMMALVKICRTVIPDMLIKRRGCIVNISSVAAQRGNRGQTVYAGSKGFIESFTRAMAAEYGAKGIRINAVAPGPIKSGALREVMAYATAKVKESVVSGRLGSPDDVAGAVAFLCSDEASYINGRIIAVDGGFCHGV